MREAIGVAVIGAGMAGRAHAAGYRAASGVFDASAPDVRLVAIADINDELAEDTRRRYGFARTEHDWQAIVDADDIDAVSVVLANHLHREVIEALLAAGKHVLCEKPLAPTVADAAAMVKAAARNERVAALGYTYRWSPGINAIRRETRRGSPGPSGALQRSRLVRLRIRSAGPDDVALPRAGRAAGCWPMSAATSSTPPRCCADPSSK